MLGLNQQQTHPLRVPITFLSGTTWMVATALVAWLGMPAGIALAGETTSVAPLTAATASPAGETAAWQIVICPAGACDRNTNTDAEHPKPTRSARMAGIDAVTPSGGTGVLPAVFVVAEDGFPVKLVSAAEAVANGAQSVADTTAAPKTAAEDENLPVIVPQPVRRPRYAEVYASIPFSRSEFIANPSYRHEATMEILLNQLRPYRVVFPLADPRFRVVNPYGVPSGAPARPDFPPIVLPR